MFSTSCHYGLQAMIYIALHSTDGKNVDLGQIAEKQEIPKHFLSKILQMLVKNGLLNSMKGPTGGFSLSRPADDITLIEVIDAIDGLDVFTQCGIGFKKCDDDHPCPIHNEYKHVRNNIRELFENKTLLELSEDIKSGESIVSLGKPLSKD
jgi:Rrf2 family transcriptional regulator, iron-sulfur cluster assembly transcription factor